MKKPLKDRSIKKVGSLAKIPLYFHWSLPLPLIGFTLLHTYQHGWPNGALPLISISMAFLIVTIHELGHCLAAQALGIRAKRITLTGIGGIAHIPIKEEKPGRDLLIVAAGPAVNVGILLLMLGTLGLPQLKITDTTPTSFFLSGEGLYTLTFSINLILLIFNLLPIYPMDGGRILKSLSHICFGETIATALVLSTCMFVGVPIALKMATEKLFFPAAVLSTMTFIGILEGLVRIDRLQKKSLSKPEKPQQNNTAQPTQTNHDNPK